MKYFPKRILLPRIRRAARGVLVGLAVCLCVRPSVAQEMCRPAFLPPHEVKVQLEQAMARIHAWRIEYEAAWQDDGNHNGVYIRKVIAARDPGSFFLWAAKGSRDYDWREDPFQQRLTLHSEKAVTEWPFNREFREFKHPVGAQLPGTAVNEPVFISLGWWSLGKMLPPATADGVETVLTAVVRSPKYSVLPEMFDVDGHWCYVLEYPRRDRVWVDPERGYCIAKRERYSSQNGTLIERLVPGGLHEVEAGIWAPAKVRRFRFGLHDSDGERVAQRATREVLTILKSIQVNSRVPDTQFTFEALPGSVSFSPPGQPTNQAVPGGTDHLDHLASWIQDLVVLPQSNASEGTAVETIVEYALINVCVLVGVVMYLRRRPRFVMAEDGVNSGA